MIVRALVSKQSFTKTPQRFAWLKTWSCLQSQILAETLASVRRRLQKLSFAVPLSKPIPFCDDYMKLSFAIIMLSFCSASSFGVDIANCENPSGHAFYPQKGLVQKKDSGWKTDGITSGRFTLTKNDQDVFDLLFVDATQRVTSTTAANGKVVLMRAYPDDIAFVVAYFDAIEIYNFWKTVDYKFHFSMLQNRGSGGVVSKSSVMVGQCDLIRFDLVK